MTECQDVLGSVGDVEEGYRFSMYPYGSIVISGYEFDIYLACLGREVLDSFANSILNNKNAIIEESSFSIEVDTDGYLSIDAGGHAFHSKFCLRLTHSIKHKIAELILSVIKSSNGYYSK